MGEWFASIWGSSHMIQRETGEQRRFEETLTRAGRWRSLLMCAALIALGVMECVSLYQVDHAAGVFFSNALLDALRWLILPASGFVCSLLCAPMQRASNTCARILICMAAFAAGIYIQRFSIVYNLTEAESLIALAFSFASIMVMMPFGGLWTMPVLTLQMMVYVAVLLYIVPVRPTIVYYFFGLVLQILVFAFSGSLYIRRMEQCRFENERRMERGIMDELLDLRDEWRQIIRKDELTNLPNQAGFNALLRHDWNHCFYAQEKLTFLMADIDLLALYNSTYGQTAGDECVRLVANRIQDIAEACDGTLARLEDGVFGLLLVGMDAEEVQRIADSICVAVDGLHIPHKASLVCEYVTVSVGWAQETPAVGASSEKLLLEARSALQAAKFGGRNRAEKGQVA